MAAKKSKKKVARKAKHRAPPMQRSQQDDDFEDPRNPDGWHPPLVAPKPKPPGPWAPDDDFEDPQRDQTPYYGPYRIPDSGNPGFIAPHWPEVINPIFGPLREPEFWGDPGPPAPPEPDFAPLPGGFEDETIPDPMAQRTGPPRQGPKGKVKAKAKKKVTKKRAKAKAKGSSGGRGRARGRSRSRGGR